MVRKKDTLTNQKAIKSAFKNVLESKGYKFYTENQYAKLDEIPEKYVITNSKYRGIYETRTTSPFKVVNSIDNISERVELTFQSSPGSVDSKFPYFYLNAATGHNDNVLMLIDGNGYKPKAREWIKNRIESRWLMSNEKDIKLVNLSEFLVYIEKKY